MLMHNRALHKCPNTDSIGQKLTRMCLRTRGAKSMGPSPRVSAITTKASLFSSTRSRYSNSSAESLQPDIGVDSGVEIR